MPADWFERYSQRVEEYRLPRVATERPVYARPIGTDGARLLTEVYAAAAPTWLRQVPAVQVLRQVWVQQYVVMDGQFRLRTAEELPPAGSRIESPYDDEARYSTKRDAA